MTVRSYYINIIYHLDGNITGQRAYTSRKFDFQTNLHPREMERKFKKFQPKICYDRPESSLTNKNECDQYRERALKSEMINSLVVPRKSAKTWTMQKGDLCKITLIEGSQV